MYPNKIKGVTFIELIVAIAVLAITVSFAIPAFKNLITERQLSSVSDNLRNALLLARSNASIATGGQVPTPKVDVPATLELVSASEFGVPRHRAAWGEATLQTRAFVYVVKPTAAGEVVIGVHHPNATSVTTVKLRVTADL